MTHKEAEFIINYIKLERKTHQYPMASEEGTVWLKDFPYKGMFSVFL